MIIQCEQCQTKFRLDDAKIKGRGVKVRCSKCRHVFLVEREEPRPETAFDELLEQYGEAAGGVQAEASGSSSSVDASIVSGGYAERAGSGLAPEKVEQGGREVGDDIPLPQSLASAAEVPQPSPSVQSDDFDFAFDFDETEKSPDSTIPPSMDTESGNRDGVETSFDFPPVTNASAELMPSDDFTIDFGELSFPQTANDDVPKLIDAGQGSDNFNLDFDNLLGGEINPTDGGVSPPQSIGIDDEIFAAVSSPAAKGDEGFGKFDFSDLDLGDLPSSAISAQGGADVHLTESPAPEKPPVPASTTSECVAEEDAELPPLTISSRRKGVSFFPAAVTVAAIFFVVILAGIGFFVVSGPETAKRMGLGFLATLTGGEVQDEGKITLGKVNAEFVTNKEAGELFVIRGETINNYSKPRASIQVKATLLAANGQAILNKPAYCGNSLTKEQLTTLPLAKIEEVMNNQFGDSLSNLGVQPGKSIPFVVVFSNVPKDAVDFSVLVAGSTVAAK